MPSPSSTTEQPDHAEWLGRLRRVVQGKSFRETDKPKDRLSGRSLMIVVEALHALTIDTGSTEATADELANIYSVRVVRRVLAFLRAEGLLIERSFRRDHSPRVERTLNWPQLRLWIQQQSNSRESETTHADQPQRLASRRVQQKVRPDSQATRRRADVVPAVSPQKQPVVPSLVRVGGRDQNAQEDQTQVMEFKSQLKTLGVSPLAIDQAAVSLETVRRLVEHFAASGLARDDGSLCYAWSPGLLYKRITDESLAFRKPDDWPKSKDEEWRRLKAKAVSTARQAREETVRQQDPEIDQRARLHQLEMRFADLLKDPSLIVERLRQVPEQNAYLIKYIRSKGINSDRMRLIALSAIERHEAMA